LKNKAKLKGFTLVELIVVVAIFGLIMTAALSIMKPVGDLFVSTSKYETARANSDNVRQYIEENLKYADKFKTVVGTDSYPSDEVDSFINYFGKTVGSGTDIPVYVMEIKNDVANVSGHQEGNLNVIDAARGQITLYKDGIQQSSFAVNYNMYNDYGFKISLSPTFSETSLSANLDIYHVNKTDAVWSGTNFTMPYETDESGNEETYYSTTVSFSMMNIHQMDTITFYHDLHVTPAKLISESEILPGWEVDVDYNATDDDKARFIDIVDLGGTSENIYFIYTLPKHVNQYSLS
jgi:prepilin-type N-terminal cleavage/methylation domain-containing protein